MIAFWKHDTYPYILSGTVTNTRDDGRVETQEYGIGYCFRPIAVLQYAEGKEIKDELTRITREYLKDVEELRKEYIDKAKQIAFFLDWK